MAVSPEEPDHLAEDAGRAPAFGRPAHDPADNRHEPSAVGQAVDEESPHGALGVELEVAAARERRGNVEARTVEPAAQRAPVGLGCHDDRRLPGLRGRAQVAADGLDQLLVQAVDLGNVTPGRYLSLLGCGGQTVLLSRPRSGYRSPFCASSRTCTVLRR